MTDTQINMGALKTPIIRYTGILKEQVPERMQCANAFLFLVLNERKNGVQSMYHQRAVQHLKNLLVSGNEPAIDAIQFWAYPATVCAITLCKHTPTIWAELSQEEIQRCDLLMTAFGVISNFIANDENEYLTGISLRGDVRKRRSANFKFPLIVPAIASAYYFGGSDAFDSILSKFDYEAFIQKAQSFGFKNLLEVWTTPDYNHEGTILPGAKKLLTTESTAYVVSKSPMDFGNIYRAGYGKGAKIPFKYRGFRACDIGIAEYLFSDNHSGGLVVSKVGDEGDGNFTCYIIDGSISPVEGQDGLLLEYNTTDTEGIRSDGFYCQMDFSMEVALMSMLKELGAWDETSDTSLFKKISVGLTDHIYKMERGYKSQGMSVQRIEIENNLRGYFYTKYIWEKYFTHS